MSNNKPVRKRSTTAHKRKRIGTTKLPHQPCVAENEDHSTQEEDIELDHTPKKVKSNKSLIPDVEMPNLGPVVDKVIATDSDDDLLNDDTFAQFCDPSIVEKLKWTNDFSIDLESEKKALYQHTKDFDDTLKEKRINDELNRLIEEEVKSSNNKIDLKSLTREERQQHLKNMMGSHDFEISYLEHIAHEGSYDQYYKDLRKATFIEEMSRFNVFDISGCVAVTSLLPDTELIDRLFEFPISPNEFCKERNNYILNSLKYNVKKIQKKSDEITLLDLPLTCLLYSQLLYSQGTFAEFSTVEDAFIVLQIIDENFCKKFQLLLRNAVKDFLNGKDIGISNQGFALIVVNFLICQNFNFGNYIGKLPKNPYLVYSTLSKTRIIETSELDQILGSLKGDYSKVITDLFNVFRFSEVSKTLFEADNLELLNALIYRFFPPTFSKFITSKPFYNTSKTIISFYKKFFACLLIKITGITEVSKEDIYSTDYEFNDVTNRQLVIPVISLLESIFEKCKGRKEFEFPLLYLVKNIFSIFDICADLGRDSSIVRIELLKLSETMKNHFRFSDYSFLKLQFPYLDASFMLKLSP